MAQRRSRLQRLVQDLHRRKVFRVAAVYGVVAFGALQVADVVVPALLLPDWVPRLLIVLIILGFPITVALAWAFDITSRGVVRTAPAPEDGTPVPAAEEAPSLPALRISRQGVAFVGIGILLALVVFGLAVPYLGPHIGAPAATRPASGERVVAVLPFASLSPDEDDVFFANGVTDDIVTALSGAEELRVIGRTTTARYSDRERKIRDIGRELNAVAVLDGSVRRQENEVRVSAQLVDVQTEETIWGGTFDRNLTDIFLIQTEIAQTIAAALQTRLSTRESDRLENRVTAYHLYLRGRRYLGSGRPEDVETAAMLFQEAIGLDGESSLARAGLADAYSRRAELGELQWADSAEALARASIELDSTRAEGYAALGSALLAKGRRDDAARELGEALRRDPEFARSHPLFAQIGE